MKPTPVLEIFGPTIQGEGMVIGRKTMFVRTGGCDYRCSWCDSAFTWDGSQKAVATGSYLGVDDFGNKIITRIPEFVMVVPDPEIG